MRLRYKIYVAVITLLGVFTLGRCGKIPQKPNGVAHTPTAVLPSEDAEQIRVNPETHQLIILTSKGSQTVTLPDRTSTIDVLKNGTVKVTSPQIGLEHHMFLGILGSEHARIGVGVDGFYWKKLDLGIGIGDQIGAYTPIVFAKATYNIKGSLQVGLIYGSDKYLGGIVSVRVF